MTGQTAGLRLGNAVKSRRAGVRRAIASGQIDVPALLEGAGDEGIEEVCLGMTVAQIVSALDGVGDVGLVRILTNAEIVIATRRLGELTIERRRMLAAAIRKEIQP